MDWTNIDDVIEMAIQHADEKWNKGLLIAINHPDYDKIMGNCMVEGVEGDPDTLYSTALLYADSKHDDGVWYDKILDALEKKYPTFG